MLTEGDDGPSGSAVEPAAEVGGIGGRGSSRKATTKYSERSTNSRSLDDTDSVVDEEQPALGAITLYLFQLTSLQLHCKHIKFCSDNDI